MKLTSINIGKEQTQQRKDFIETTGIYKMPVNEPVKIKSLGIDGDAICDVKSHGGVDQALYIYGGADYTWWSQELGKELAPGTFGENLTISELESAQFNVGDYLHIGSVTLQVTAPRIPCDTFATRMGDPQWVKKFRAAERPGLYCRIIKEGVIQAGNSVSLKNIQTKLFPLWRCIANITTNKRCRDTERHLRAPIAVRERVKREKRLQELQAQN